jgi:hypothetical protein
MLPTEAEIKAAEDEADRLFKAAERANNYWRDWDFSNINDTPPWWSPATDSVWVLVRVWLGANLSPAEIAQILEAAANAVFDRFLERYERRRGKRLGNEDFVTQWLVRQRREFAEYADDELLPRVDEIVDSAPTTGLAVGENNPGLAGNQEHGPMSSGATAEPEPVRGAPPTADPPPAPTANAAPSAPPPAAVPVGPEPTAPPAGKKARKEQSAVVVDRTWLMKELEAVRTKRPGLKLTPASLASNSPQGCLHPNTWRKLLNRQPVRSDVPDHLFMFFKHFGRDLEVSEIPLKDKND